MIVKPRDKPTHILQMEALSRRMPAYHPNKDQITQQARNLRAGYNGEKSLDFILSFLPKKEYCIFHNLRIEDEYGAFQIDTLLLTTRYALIVEVKNIYGTITFDDLGQTIRTKDDGTEQGFNNPIEQVKLQEFRLRKWLNHHLFPSFPIERLVVYSNSHTILKNITNCKVIASSILHKENLLGKIELYSSRYQIEALTGSELVAITSALNAAHKVNKTDLLMKYGLKKAELLSGVFCPDCDHFAMVYRNRKWHCSRCGCVSRDAYKEALEDYRLLIGGMIKNREARAFLGISSIHVMKRLLMEAGYEFSGEKSARKYILSDKSMKS